MANIKCFYIFLNGLTQRYLRRYRSVSKDDNPCPLKWGYHDAQVLIDKGLIGEPTTDVPSDPNKADPRWPTHCACGYAFEADDEWQLFIEQEYVRQDTGEIMLLRDAPTGAIWRAGWYEDTPDLRGIDGRSFICRLPDGSDWAIDSRARNCTMPNDHVHKCWCRHGEPPNFTVNKVGNTCQAGAGSIQSKNWHGFLTNGELIQC